MVIYYLAMLDKPGRTRFQEAEADPVAFKGFEEFHFFIHQSTEIYFLKEDRRQWVVSEATTGLAIGNGADQDKAEEMAQERIYAVGVDAFREKIQENIQKTGRSPWVKK